MAARAIWKGVLIIGKQTVPVKLYSAVSDRSVHFRLLHRKDKAPVRQRLVNAETGGTVPREQVLSAYPFEDGSLVMFDNEELEALQPKDGRDVDLLAFLPLGAIDHRWYDRPYYLGPDGDEEALNALTAALDQDHREGLASWVMRGKAYLGALRLHQGQPLLMTLRAREEVIPIDELSAPQGSQLDNKELDMACRLIEMMEGDFQPDQYHDEYRQRVLDLVATKQRGGRVKKTRVRRRRGSSDLSKALQASLARESKNG